MSNAQERGMREFWICFGMHEGPDYAHRSQSAALNCQRGPPHCYVREVDPSAPDYKKLAEDLAAALEKCHDEQDNDFVTTVTDDGEEETWIRSSAIQETASAAVSAYRAAVGK